VYVSKWALAKNKSGFSLIKELKTVQNRSKNLIWVFLSYISQKNSPKNLRECRSVSVGQEKVKSEHGGQIIE